MSSRCHCGADIYDMDTFPLETGPNPQTCPFNFDLSPSENARDCQLPALLVGCVEGHAGTSGKRHWPLGKCWCWWKTQIQPRDEPAAGKEGFRVLAAQMHELEGSWCAKSDVLVLRC